MPLKAKLYSDDVYYRDSAADLRETLGEGAVAALRPVSLLLVKPDGLRFGKARTVLDFIASNGFAPISLAEPVIRSWQWRELWRYQLTSATLDRLAVNDLVMPGRSLLLILRDLRPGLLPGSVRLQSLKGSSTVAAQQSGCLRQLLGQPNRVLSFVHCADEPADVVRELGILMPPDARRRLIAAMTRSDLPADAQERLERISASGSGKPPDPARALRRVRRAVEAAASPAAAGTGRLLEAIARMESGLPIAWRAFAQDLRDGAIPAARWDLATIGSQFIEYDDPGRSKLIPPLDHKVWL